MKFECRCCYGDHPTPVCPKAKQPIPDYGELVGVQEFYQCVRVGGYTNDDGSGYYSDGVYMFRNEPAVPSVLYKFGIDDRFSHVMWFNK